MPSTARSGTGKAESDGEGVHIVHTLFSMPLHAPDRLKESLAQVAVFTPAGAPPFRDDSTVRSHFTSSSPPSRIHGSNNEPLHDAVPGSRKRHNASMGEPRPKVCRETQGLCMSGWADDL
ncbi:hypothetical protein GCM10027405_31710 [Arthrobacter alkaliphilus]